MFEGISVKDIVDFGITGVVVAAVLSGLLLPRWTLTRLTKHLEEDRDAWKAVALRAIGTGEVAVTALETIKDKAAEQ
jgi:hypothetical protein